MIYQRRFYLLVAFILLSSACSTPMPEGRPESPTAQGAHQTAQPRISPQQPPHPGSPPTVPALTFPSPLILFVSYFEDRAAQPELRWWREGLAEMLIAELSRRPDLIVIQRERVDEVIREQSLAPSGRITDETGLRIGQVLGATVLVTGRLTVPNGNVRLDARLIEIEQRTVLGTASAEGPIDHAPAVATELVERVLRLLPGPSKPLIRCEVRVPNDAYRHPWHMVPDLNPNRSPDSACIPSRSTAWTTHGSGGTRAAEDFPSGIVRHAHELVAIALR